MNGAVHGLDRARPRLIVALDVPSVAAAEAMVARLGEAVSFYKIGYQLAFAGGLDFARALARAGKQVFLDLKLHDIGNTVAKGVESVAQLGATFLTVHAYPQTMHAAVDARAGSGLRILAVTVLTSYDDADLAAAGYDFTVPELVAERAAQARDIGVDGLVCSAEEAAMLRPIVGAGMVLVTPGIRPAGADSGRPEAHHDAGGSDRGRRRLSGGRPADPRGAGSEGRRRSDRRRDRGGGATIGRRRDGQGLLDSAPRCQRSGRLQGLHGRDPARRTANTTAMCWCAAGREVVEGTRRSRNVLREFPDYATALACYRSPEYQRAKPLRLPHSACDFVIVEGYDGAQPQRRPRRPPPPAKATGSPMSM